MKISILCVALAIIPLCLSAEVVHIPDANLERVLREAMQLDSSDHITVQHIAELQVLNAQDQGIKELSGLEYATSLTELRLGENPITDISPLAQLTQLSLLRLNDIWGIIDISPLAHLTQLNWLDLDRNLIVDIRPLAGLTGLTSLDIRYNQIENLRSLANLTHLTALHLGGNPIEDIGPLANLTQLTFLRLNDNPLLENIGSLANLAQLRVVYLDRNAIVDISPLAGLTALTSLDIRYNQIENLGPLANLTQLTRLLLNNNKIVDISPLAHLTQLTELSLGGNQIEDISPLENLTQLTRLLLNNNRITDVNPLAKLTRLDFLDIRHNKLPDYTTLVGLSLSKFFYDQTCDMPPLPLEPRLENRNYPSIFARWSGFGWPPISNRPDLSDAENIALHDLHFGGYGLPFLKVHDGYRMAGDVNHATHLRDEVLDANPNLITLATISMRGEALHILGENWPYWIRDERGNIFREHNPDGTVAKHGLMDFTHPAVQDMIVQQAVAVSKCGLYDGIVFDYWSEQWRVLSGWDGTHYRYFYSLEEELQARSNIVSRIRAETRPNFLIMGNTNYFIIPKTGIYLNGGFMETGIPEHRTGADLERVINAAENALLWLEHNLREPRINGLEGFSIPGETLDSPNNRRWMRALTTLSLTHSDGYVLYSESGVFTHYWYDFWDADLGRPVGEKGQLYQKTDGLYIREFTNGWAVYNHSEETQIITLPEEVQGVASGLVNTEHELSNLDGEMYLRVESANPADVNEDGVVNIFDLTLVAQAISTEVGEGDVNGDGVVNVFDLVFVPGQSGWRSCAFRLFPELLNINASDVEKWLALAGGIGIGDANFQQGIRFLEGLLAALTPKETTLLPNYPNPFNPETWIPYRLAHEAEVAITIYDTKGTQVRRLAFGNQAAGYYAERGKAAYWDGRNDDGEAVASGIYICQFRAEDYAASRRMVIVK